jgi:NADPH-dependent 2,4-dienoyl-CoA reductase/sulfur reductase-like enzyme
MREGSPAWFRARSGGIRTIVDTSVVDAPGDGILTLSGPLGREVQRYDVLILCTGAYDRALPLPGWTLPAVFTAGGALAIAKSHRVAIGQRVVIAGYGPFLLPVADGISGLGARVTVIDATTFRGWARGAPALARDPRLAREVGGYVGRLLRRGVRYLPGRSISKLVGDDQVREVVHCRVDGAWNPIPGSEKHEPVDAVALGFGFCASTELAQLLGCELRYDEVHRGYVVSVDELMLTTVPGILAAGEVTGFGGERVARLEGRLAGLSAAHYLGLIATSEYETRRAAAARELAGLRSAVQLLGTTIRPRDGLWSGLKDDTIVCRCEDVRLGRVTQLLDDDQIDPRAVKAATRAGMGLCQGRTCSNSITEILRVSHGYAPPLSTRPWTVRPPLRPISLAEFATSSTDTVHGAGSPSWPVEMPPA